MSVELSELTDSTKRVVEAIGVAAPEDEAWKQVIELGWLLVSVPEELGGLDAGLAGASALNIELGRGLVTAPYIAAMMSVAAVCHSELEDKENWIEQLVSGQLVSAPLSQCKLTVSGDSLSGKLVGVPSADIASHCLAWADNGAVVLLPLDQSAVQIQPKSTWDETRRLFDVDISSAPVSSAVVLANGQSEQASDLVRRISIQKDFGLAAEAIGGASAILEQTVEHLQTRVQFKRPFAMFQALKHRCADMKADIVAAEAMLFDAIAANGDSGSEAMAAKSKAVKLFATGVFADTTEDCLQLHGGIGMADEYPCHLYLKRSLLSQQLSGSNNQYAAALADELIQSCS